MRTVVGFALNNEISMVVEAPRSRSQKIVVNEKRKGVAGSPATVARILRVLGMPVHVLGVVGQDGEREKFQSVLAGLQISHDLFPLRQATPETYCAINGCGEGVIYSHRDPLIMDGGTETVLSKIKQVAGDLEVGCVVATSVRPEDVPLAEALFAAAPLNALRVINPNLHLIRDVDAFKAICSLATLLIVNRPEAEEVLSASEKEDAELLAQGLLKHTPEAIVTLGPAGSFYFNRSGEHLYQAAPNINVVDTVGAGDTFLGGFIAGRLKGFSNMQAMQLAAAAAAAKIKHLGSYSPPGLSEVEAYL